MEMEDNKKEKQDLDLKTGTTSLGCLTCHHDHQSKRNIMEAFLNT
jgi:hypothetical protein